MANEQRLAGLSGSEETSRRAEPRQESPIETATGDPPAMGDELQSKLFRDDPNLLPVPAPVEGIPRVLWPNRAQVELRASAGAASLRPSCRRLSCAWVYAVPEFPCCARTCIFCNL